MPCALQGFSVSPRILTIYSPLWTSRWFSVFLPGGSLLVSCTADECSAEVSRETLRRTTELSLQATHSPPAGPPLQNLALQSQPPWLPRSQLHLLTCGRTPGSVWVIPLCSMTWEHFLGSKWRQPSGWFHLLLFLKDHCSVLACWPISENYYFLKWFCLFVVNVRG